jgi:hypothetical protein
VKLAREMYDETGEDGKRKHTVATIAAEFGVSRPTIYRHLGKTTGSDSEGGRFLRSGPRQSERIGRRWLRVW